MKRMCFTKSGVEGEIYVMKEKISTNKILASTSLVFGILSLFSFVFYFYRVCETFSVNRKIVGLL